MCIVSADKRQNPSGIKYYIVSPSRLSDIESNGKTPNLYRLHALSLAYDCGIGKLLNFLRHS